MKSVLSAAVLGFALPALAGLVSDESKMFFTGGEWLPDAVPNRAIYDGPPSNKTLRVNAEVTAGVWSTLSGLLERRILAGGTWPYKSSYTPLTSADFKTNYISFLEWQSYDVVKDLARLAYPSNRVITSARLLANLPNSNVGMMDAIRSAVLALPNADGMEWGQANARRGSTWFPEPTGFPTWDWTNDLQTAVSLAGFDTRWPEYEACTSDGVWKTNSVASRSGLRRALRHFDFDYRHSSFLDGICETAIPATCLSLLTNRLGESASTALTNSTRRLSYYGLGALQCAIGSMDATYPNDPIYLPPFEFASRNFSLRKGWSSTEITSSATFSSDGTVTFSSSPDWETYSNLETTTNSDFYAYSQNPAFYCSADTRSYNATAYGTVTNSAAISFSQLHEWMQGGPEIELEISVDGESLTVSVVAGRTLSGGWTTYGSATYDIPTSPVRLVLDAAASRYARVDFTPLSVSTNSSYYIRDPSSTAMEFYHPVLDVHAAESRFCVTNYNDRQWVDPGDRILGYYTVGTGMEDRSYRSVSLASTASTNAIWNAVSTARLAHYYAVRSMFADRTGSDITTISDVLDFNTALLSGVRTRAEALSSGTWSIYRDYLHEGVSHYYVTNDSSDYYNVWYLDGGTMVHVTTVYADGSLRLAGLQFTAGATGLGDPIPALTPCSAEGRFEPIVRAIWTWRNLHGE